MGLEKELAIGPLLLSIGKLFISTYMCGIEGVTFSGIRVGRSFRPCVLCVFYVSLCTMMYYCALFYYVQRFTLLCLYISKGFCFLPDTRINAYEK